ncbi:ribokinase [Actinacidiphila soli]|uniref:ribokinase n=1 Tax=Actinacidiphila soli TaxID=2487275 RepID=UPI001F0BA45D|nr:ribokinase [Actinacidiphila soli]
MADIVVVGSINIDSSFGIDRLPHAGETLQVEAGHTAIGGKGANQAVALARLGADAAMIGMVGTDDDGDLALTRLRREGLAVPEVRRGRAPTGRAIVLLGPSGESTVLLAAGANADLGREDVLEHGNLLASARCVLVQLETGDEAVRAAVESATNLVVLNPAPARTVPDHILKRVDVLVPNRLELAQMCGLPGAPARLEDVEELARGLAGPRAIVVTLGGDGCLVLQDGTATHLPAEPAEVVDTTGAGDSFCGALVNALMNGADLVEAARAATAAAAVSVARSGAMDSLPTAAELPPSAAAAGNQGVEAPGKKVTS